MAPRKFLVDLHRLVRASLTSWFGIPRHSAIGLIHSGINSGGLSVPVCYQKLVTRSLRTVKLGAAGVTVTSRRQLDAEYSRWLTEEAQDGCVVRGIDFNVKSGRWLSMALFPDRLSNIEIRQMTNTRLGPLPTPARLSRIGRGLSLRCDCRTRHKGSLGHIREKCV